jgi:hypothetical protein
MAKFNFGAFLVALAVGKIYRSTDFMIELFQFGNGLAVG